MEKCARKVPYLSRTTNTKRRVFFVTAMWVSFLALFLFRRNGTFGSLFQRDLTSTLPRLDPDPRVIDCFTFNTELDMLEFRFKTLDSVVDIFVLGEANSTFSGKVKPLIFGENKARFTPYLHKIQHVIVEDSPNKGDAWENERFQRDALVRGFEGISPPLRPTDLIIGTDVDEVPDPRSLMAVKQHGNLKGAYIFEMDSYYYSFRFRNLQKWGPSPKIIDGQTFLEDKSITFSTLRSRSKSPILPLRGGWHMSYFGGVDFIRNKLDSFSHQDLNTKAINNADNILNAIKTGKDLFGRSSEVFETIELTDNEYLPLHHELITAGVG